MVNFDKEFSPLCSHIVLTDGSFLCMYCSNHSTVFISINYFFFFSGMTTSDDNADFFLKPHTLTLQDERTLLSAMTEDCDEERAGTCTPKKKMLETFHIDKS